MYHANAPLTFEGRRRLIERCLHRPQAHVAAEMGISRQCVSKWFGRWRRYGELGLYERSSQPHRQPTATSAETIAKIEDFRREHKWSARRIAAELREPVSVRTVSRVLERAGLNRRKFIDPGGEVNRQPQRIRACWPGHMVHLDVKKAGRIPDGGGWRAHGKGSPQALAGDRAKATGTTRGGYAYLHSAIELPRVLWRVGFPERMMIMPAQRKYPRELKERAVRLVVEARKEDPELSVTAAVKRIGARTGVNADTLRGWFKQAEIDTGQRPGTTTTDATRIKQLEAEVGELRRANEILLAASSFFARELDPRLPW